MGYMDKTLSPEQRTSQPIFWESMPLEKGKPKTNANFTKLPGI